MSKKTTKLLGRREKVISKDKNGENAPKIEIVDVISMHCNAVNNSVVNNSSKSIKSFIYICAWETIWTIPLHSLTMLKITNAEI